MLCLLIQSFGTNEPVSQKAQEENETSAPHEGIYNHNIDQNPITVKDPFTRFLN